MTSNASRKLLPICCAALAACSSSADPPGPGPVDAEPVRDQPTIPFRDVGSADRFAPSDAAADARAETATPPDAPSPDAPPVPCTLTEGSAARWTTVCMDNGTMPCTPTLTDDAQEYVDGQSSLRWRCAGCGFDSWIAYAAPASGWDLSGFSYLELRLRTQLDEAPLGWQKDVYGHPPWVILRDRGGRSKRIEPAPATSDVLLDGSIDKWLVVSVPLGAAAGWQSATDPGFTASDVTSLEIHVDPWGGGFTLWLDGAAFGPGVFSGCG